MYAVVLRGCCARWVTEMVDKTDRQAANLVALSSRRAASCGSPPGSPIADAVVSARAYFDRREGLPRSRVSSRPSEGRGAGALVMGGGGGGVLTRHRGAVPPMPLCFGERIPPERYNLGI